MRRPRTITGNIARSMWLTRPRRRLLFLLLTFAFGLLALFPERYRAAATLTPTDPSSFGLGGALGQLGAVNSAFGNQSAVEVSLKVARSIYVRKIVSNTLHLPQRLALSPLETDRWLQANVEVRVLRGGILQIEATRQDQDFARQLVTVTTEAVRDRLAEIARAQTAYKRRILLQLVDDASDRLARARGAFDQFRLSTRYSDPYGSISAISSRIPVIEQAIKAKDVQLAAARRLTTDENQVNKQLLAQRAALTGQLAEAQALNPGQTNTVGRVVQQSTQAEKLIRDLGLAEDLYVNYRKYLLGTSVEELTSSSSIRLLEPPFVDTERQFNMIFVALFVLTALAAVLVEFYEFRPPVGDAAYA